ncbi:HEPN domain-containing protein [Cyanobacteria bacterium FACHB-63]|nr:HEPN domain-containing protein [Cyanobacteria bacterium FACHB-63]
MTQVSRLLGRTNEELAAAELLLVNNLGRVCVSRCYYAMFYAAQACLASKSIESRTHRGVIQLFGQHFIKTGELPKDFSQLLSETYTLRQVGDYDDDELTDSQFESTLAAAQLFVNRVEQLLL